MAEIAEAVFKMSTRALQRHGVGKRFGPFRALPLPQCLWNPGCAFATWDHNYNGEPRCHPVVEERDSLLKNGAPGCRRKLWRWEINPVPNDTTTHKTGAVDQDTGAL